MLLAIIDGVFIMPKVQHHKDTTFKSVNKPRNIERTGCGTNDYEKKRKDYKNMRERKYGLLDEYIENLDTPVIRRYPTLSDVPGDAKAFVLRYEIEARNHYYLNTHPTRVESWSADIARALLTLSDSEESSSSHYSSSSSQSASSSTFSPSSERNDASSPIQSPTSYRRQPLYASRHRLPSPVLRRGSSSSSSSSATSSYPPPPTISLINIDNDQPSNSDLVETIKNNREEQPTRFSTPTKKRKINSLQAQYIRMMSVQSNH